MGVIEENSLGVIVLAGQNQGIKARIKERLDKTPMGWIYFEPFISGEYKSLLPIIKFPSKKRHNLLTTLYGIWKHREERRSEEPESLGTNLEKVIQACEESRYISQDKIYPVGPKLRIKNIIQNNRINVQQQGSDIQENSQLGVDALCCDVYSPDYFLLLSGDTPLITGGCIDEFIENSQRRDSKRVDAYVAASSRTELKEFIIENHLEKYRTPKYNYPRPFVGNLHKFGIPLIDDRNVSPKKDRDTYMLGNMFLIKTETAIEKGDMINELYELKRAVIPMIRNIGLRKTIEAFRGKWTVSQAEKIFQEIKGLKVNIALAPPACALDIDTYRDRARCAAYLFNQKRIQNP